ncbi:DUF4044 domain-containing protein [Lactococcus hodotermopsidis]|nr:DUF4044 domain-containing protein [Lactococcus hodotermopsidis]
MAYKKEQKSTFQKVVMIIVWLMLILTIFTAVAMAVSVFI